MQAQTSPLIAVNCDLYFTALQSVRLGILTDGLKFEFFADCEAPNIMDVEPFLSLDIEKLPTADNLEVMELLLAVCSERYSPDHVLELAETRFLAERVRSALLQEMRQPSEELCRHVLQKVGLKNLRKSSIQSHYAPVIQKGFEQAIIVPVIRLLQQSAGDREGDGSGTEMRIVTTDRENAVYNYVCRRLAYLAKDEREYSAIERVKFKDYQGKFAIYYENVRKGRLLDFVEGANGYDRFVFPAPLDEVVTNSMTDLDEPLRRIFGIRLQEASNLPQPNLRAVG